jgi:uncharacterized protein YhaN
MIISEIHIDGFGIFNGLSVINLKKGVNILVGDNEAGKSTLLKFLKFTLFGYPRFREQRMSPLSGGSHGGRIKAILSTDKQAIFERRGDDKIVLSYDGQNSSNETQWLQLLGNATEDIYKNVYAFSLAELIDMDSLSVSGVADKIFSIGAGLNISIGEVLNDIQGRTDQIYSARGSKQLIPSIMKEIQDKKNQLNDIQGNLPLYHELTEAIRNILTETSEIENKLSRYRIEKEKKENYLKCYESFVTVVRIDEELAQLPDVQSFPENGFERLNVLEKEEKELKDKIAELQNGGGEDIGIDDIEKTLRSFSFNSEILNEKAKVNHLRANLEKYKQAITDRLDTAQKINSMNSSIHEQMQAINSDWTEHNITGFLNIIAYQDRIKDFRKKFESIKQDKSDLESQKRALIASGSRINSTNAMILISLVFLLGSIPMFYYSLDVAGIIFIVIALLIFFGRSYLIKESHVERIGKALPELYNKEKDLLDNYGNYLEEELKLDRTLSIETVVEILKTVAQLNKDIIGRDDLYRKQKETKDPFIEDFENEVQWLSNLLKDKEHENNIETLTGQILDEFDHAEAQSKEQERLEKEFSRRIKELERNQNKLSESGLAITELLKEVNATDRNDLRAKHEFNAKAMDLTEKRRNAIRTIEAIVGLNMADNLIEFLKTNDQSSLREGILKLEENIDSMTEDLSSRNKELGEKKGEMKKIEGGSQLAEIMTELEIERQKLTTAYKEWITDKIALKILTDVREKYEKEKQPVIIQNSSRYFDRITSGRYNRINVSLDKREITIFDSRQASKNIDQLSRGTREQLLISLRLGFIEEYETRSEPLPVIVDEVLVNFDPDRAKKTAEIFHDFGKERQIIFFTCHPAMVEYFDRSAVNLIDLQS